MSHAHQDHAAVSQDHVAHSHVVHLSVNQDTMTTTTAAINCNLHATGCKNLQAEGVIPSVCISRKKKSVTLAQSGEKSDCAYKTNESYLSAKRG